MDRRRTWEIGLAILAVLAVLLVAIAAAPLFSADQGGERPPTHQRPTPNESSPQLDRLLGFPVRLVVTGIVAVGVLAVALQFASDPWGTLEQLLGVGAGIALFAGAVWVALSLVQSPSRRGQPPPGSTTTPTPTPRGSVGFGDGTSDPALLPAEAVAIVVLVTGILGAAAVLVWRSDAIRSAIGLADDTGSSEPDAELRAVGRVAGNAADRAEAASTPRAADNAIYRAWSRMVALLDVPDPRSDTPRQFAAAAIEAGMNPDDVTVLTRTFEEIRYGDAPLTERRREEALAAFGRIETSHGDDAGGADAPRSVGDPAVGDEPDAESREDE